MKKIKTYHLHSAISAIAGIAMGITLWSCSDTIEQDGVNPNMPCIELSFTNESTSRADESVLGFTQTEKQMNTVDVFFYTTDAGDETKSVKVVHIDNTAHETKHNIYIPADSVDIVFGPEGSTDRTCRIYTVVNVSKAEYEKAGITKDATISQLRNLKATTATFATMFNGFAMFTKSETGDVVTYDAQARKAAGVIKVKNLAAKIDLFVSFDKEVEGVDPTGTSTELQKWNVWEPKMAEAYIVNGVQSVRLDGWNGTDFLNSDDYYDSRTEFANNTTYSRNFADSKEADKETYPYVINAPFYTYPNTWTQDPMEQHQTYLLLKVNWLPTTSQSVEDDLIETYYKVPINLSDPDKNQLVSNKYYRVKIKINTLGGINFGKPLELDNCSWEILDWGSTNLDADIREIRWLEVSQKQKDINDGEEYTAVMYNTSSVSIPFNSTHKVIVKSVTMTYMNFTDSDDSPYEPKATTALRYKLNGKTTLYGPNEDLKASVFTLDDTKLAKYGDAQPEGLYIDATNHNLIFYHSLSTLYEVDGIYRPIGQSTYSPFSITIVLQHEDDPTITKTITIKQYPGVYITHEKNIGNLGYKANGGRDRGGVYINGEATDDFSAVAGRDTRHNCDQLGGTTGMRTREYSDNPNMYTINVTQLSAEDIAVYPFHIGDPRTKNINNNLTGNSAISDMTNLSSWGKAGSTTSLLKREICAYRWDAVTAVRLYDRQQGTTDATGQLKYYYPTDESEVNEQAYMLAPKFRFASAYGCIRDRSDEINRETARIRCASYQEMGYPAGRWRMPTRGEFQYIYLLNQRGVIPDIFGRGRYPYWTAQGYFKALSDGTLTSNTNLDERHVRCVYDDWYWVKDDNSTQDNIQHNIQYVPAKYHNNSLETFVWGDKPKNNPQDQPQD